MYLMYVLCPVLSCFDIGFFIFVYKFVTDEYCALRNERKENMGRVKENMGHVEEEWKDLPHFFVVTPKPKCQLHF